MYPSVGGSSRKLVTFNPDEPTADQNQSTPPSTSSVRKRPIASEYGKMRSITSAALANKQSTLTLSGRARESGPSRTIPVPSTSTSGPSTPLSQLSSGPFTGSTPTTSASTQVTTPPTPSPITPHYGYDLDPDMTRLSPTNERDDSFHYANAQRYPPSHSRTPSNASGMESSPLTAGSSSTTSSYAPIPYEKPLQQVLLDITLDGGQFRQVDITGVNGGQRIRERILSQLGFPAEYHEDFALYKTEWGTTPAIAKEYGKVSDSKLMEQCHGAASNNKTSLKYYIEYKAGTAPLPIALPVAGPSRPEPRPIQMTQPGTSPGHTSSSSPEVMMSPTSAVSGGSSMPPTNGYLPQHIPQQRRPSPTHTSPIEMPPPPLPQAPHIPSPHPNTLHPFPPSPPTHSPSQPYWISPPPYEPARDNRPFPPPAEYIRAQTPQGPLTAPPRTTRDGSRGPPMQYQPGLSNHGPPPSGSMSAYQHGRTPSETARRPLMPGSAPPTMPHAPPVMPQPPYELDTYAVPSPIGGPGEGYSSQDASMFLTYIPQRPPPLPQKTERRKVSIDEKGWTPVRSPSPAGTSGLYAVPPNSVYGRSSEERERESQREAQERERAERERLDRERDQRERERGAERERERQPTPLGMYDNNGRRLDTSVRRLPPPSSSTPRLASPTSGNTLARVLSHSKSQSQLRSNSSSALLPFGPNQPPSGASRTQSATAAGRGGFSPVPSQASQYVTGSASGTRPGMPGPSLNTTGRRYPSASGYSAQSPYAASSPISPEKTRRNGTMPPPADTSNITSPSYSDNSLTPTSSIPTPPSTLRNKPPTPFNEPHTPSDTTNQRTLARTHALHGRRAMTRTPTHQNSSQTLHVRRDSESYGGGGSGKDTDEGSSPSSPSPRSSQSGPATPLTEDTTAIASGTDEESGTERPAGTRKRVGTKRNFPAAPPPNKSVPEDLSTWKTFWNKDSQGSFSRPGDDASRTLMPHKMAGRSPPSPGPSTGAKLSSNAPSPALTPSPKFQATIQLQSEDASPGAPIIQLPELDEDQEDDATLWRRPPQPIQRPGTPSKPKLQPIRTEQINGRSSRGNSPMNSAGQPSSDKGYGDWALRPQPEDVYDRLEEYFPGHDLDKPVVETASAGGKSPVDEIEPLGQAPPAGANLKDKYKHKKSIRYVANAARKQLAGGDGGDDQKTVMRRKRTTKIWGSKIEEVAPGQGLQTPSEPDSPAGLGQRPTVRYTKGQLIGKGTYGRVYMGMNLGTGEMLAIKQVELPRTESDRADNRQQLVVEAIKSESNTLKDLDHPNIVQYLGCEETEDFFNIFLEYVPGGSVGHTLRRYGKFREDVIKNITHQILDGLAYLHAMGITHRDLKADNILIDHEGNCKISDFGTSKRAQDAYANQAGATLMTGSIPWMAPEMLVPQADGYGAKVDIWSLGCVFLEMWAGERPWSQDELYQVMYKVMTNKQAPPVPDNVQLSVGAEEFRLKCCAINPDDRPTAAALREDAYLMLPKDWRFPPFQTISARPNE